MENLLRNKADKVIDFNTQDYQYITNDDASFYDSRHLSKIGADRIIEVFNNHGNWYKSWRLIRFGFQMVDAPFCSATFNN